MAGLITFRANAIVRRALKLRTAIEGVSQQDAILAILENALTTEINEVRERGLVDDSDQPQQPRGRGRRRKARKDE